MAIGRGESGAPPVVGGTRTPCSHEPGQHDDRNAVGRACRSHGSVARRDRVTVQHFLPLLQHSQLEIPNLQWFRVRHAMGNPQLTAGGRGQVARSTRQMARRVKITPDNARITQNDAKNNARITRTVGGQINQRRGKLQPDRA